MTQTRSHTGFRLLSVLPLLVALAASPVLAQQAEIAGPAEIDIERLLDGKPDTMRDDVQAAIAATRSALGGATPAFATFLNRIGVAFQKRGLYADAQPLFAEALAIREKALGLGHDDTALSLNNLAATLKGLGRSAEAEPLYRRALALREENRGPNDPATAQSLANLALVLLDFGRLDEAEPMMRRALAIREGNPASREIDVAFTLNNLGSVLEAAGKHTEAEAAYIRSLEMQRRLLSPDDTELGTIANNLAGLYMTMNRFAEAETFYLEALRIKRTALGPDHVETGSALSNLGSLYVDQARYREAEPMLNRARSIFTAALGPDHPTTSTVTANLARLYQDMGRLAEAEVIFVDVIDRFEKVRGPNHPITAAVIANFAGLRSTQGRYVEAERLYKRAIAIDETALGASHPTVALDLNNLAALYARQGRDGEAEALYDRALAIRRAAFGENNRSSANSMVNLAAVYGRSGRDAEAETLYRQAIAIYEKVLGKNHPDVAVSYNNFADVLVRLNRPAEAETYWRAALTIREATLGPGHPAVAESYSNLAGSAYSRGDLDEAAGLYRKSIGILSATLGARHGRTAAVRANLARVVLTRGDWQAAADELEQATQAIVVEMQRETMARRRSTTGKARSATAERGVTFRALARTYYRLAEARGGSAELIDKAFVAAQWASGSEAAAAIAQMASRHDPQSPALAVLTRERQDLVAEWQRGDALLTAELSKGGGGAAEVIRQRQAGIDQRLAAIDAQLTQDFADYAALTDPVPLSIAEVQAQLEVNEVMLAFVDTERLDPLPAETFLWAIPKSGAARMLRLPATPDDIMQKVADIRALLGVGPASRSAVSLAAPKDTKPAQMLETAHELHAILLGQVGDMIDGKSLLVVNSKSISSLPLHLLVGGETAPTDFAAARWLVLDHPIAYLPSVASLQALAAKARKSTAATAYVGIGNPLLSGARGDDRRAWDRGGCGGAPATTIAGGALSEAPGLAAFFTGSLADTQQVRRLAPLPETVDELCDVASRLRVGPDSLLLGAEASERTLKRRSAAGDLTARMVHFATHGLVAGELAGLAEPAIVLTPPDEGSPEDDGLLTASEVTTLKLDADWVILSACNTAAGGADAEPLSGLARAFFYSGARAMLVSHWPVDSQAAVELATGAIDVLAGDPQAGKAEALRRAMMGVLGKGGRRADPAYWAPFVTIGSSR